MERCFRNNTIVCLLKVPLLPCEIYHVHAPDYLSSLQVLVPPRRRRTCLDATFPSVNPASRVLDKMLDDFQFDRMTFGVE